MQEQNGGSIPGTGFAIEEFQALYAKRAIENGIVVPGIQTRQ
jgi:hypothetical protein